jgi:hypothetical protein
MINEKTYRLGEYRITVFDDVLIRWERHAPLGNAQTGRCFLWDNVLIIGKQTREEDGFLIGEFYEKLGKLPPWTRTRYHCFVGELFDTATGQPLSEEMLEQRNRISPSVKFLSPGARRLGHFLITVNPDSSISWRTCRTRNRMVRGLCGIESGILVISAEEQDEPGKNKQEFLETLGNLQPWDGTDVWCRGHVLRWWSDSEQEEPGIIARVRDRFARPVVHRESAAAPTKRAGPKPGPGPEPSLTSTRTTQNGEIAYGFFLSGWRAILKIRQRVQAGKFRLKWKWLNRTVAFVIALLLALVAAFYIADEFHWTHSFKKHHHKHHEH